MSSKPNIIPSQIREDVFYTESPDIQEEDNEHIAAIYELHHEKFEHPISVVFGKPKYQYESKGIAFFPVYAVRLFTVRACIGVLEVRLTDLTRVYNNETKEVVVEEMKHVVPLLFSFVKERYLEKVDANPKLYDKTRKQLMDKVVQEKALKDAEEEEELAPDDREVHLHLRSAPPAVAASSPAKHEIFKKIPNFVAKPPLKPETKVEADSLRKAFKESPQNTWIKNFMRNNEYDIQVVEDNGDCFFAVVREAFAYIGKKVTVAELRNIVANEYSYEQFTEMRDVYTSVKNRIKELESQQSALKRPMSDLKAKAMKKDISREHALQLTNAYNEMLKTYRELKGEIEDSHKIIAENFSNVEKIDTLEKMRDFIRTTAFWADEATIGIIEHALNVKMIVFSEREFLQTEGAAPNLHGVLRCGAMSPKVSQRMEFAPDHYIMTAFSGNHYNLITYKDCKIFEFLEVPFDVKMQVLNRCLAKNSGTFAFIPDFMNLKTKFAIDEAEGTPDDFTEFPGAFVLFNPEKRLVFHARANSSVKPGEADGEFLPAAERAEFYRLKKNWRRMLDDEFDKTPIYVDDHKWTSVEHFLQAIKYKDSHPDVYEMFSLDVDPNSKLATNVQAAKKFKGIEMPLEDKDKEEKKKKKVQVITIDSGYTQQKANIARKRALQAKFQNNPDLGNVLFQTRDALLLRQDNPNEPAKPDIALMEVRRQLFPV